MKSVSVSELKASLSEYLRAVRAGEEVIVTDRGKPVARMTKIEGAEAENARRSRLARQGILSPRKDKPRKLAPPPGDQSAGVLDALMDEREEGR